MVSVFFSEEKVSEIRQRSSILEVISDYVSLKKTGKNYKGLCPLHSEKTPSFMVNEEKQIFHCFGCGEGGDIFTFLMKVSQLSFPQAVEELAKRCGVKLLPRESSPVQKREMEKKEVLFKINQIASEYFHELLTRRKEGSAGRDYLFQRGIKEEIIKEYRLGYSADRWDGLVQHLREKKISPEMAWELGLILPKKKEGWYDAFRGRILFPIFDLSQRVVGFGGRLIKDGQPKYINSPESRIYHKGEVLYGLHAAKKAITERDCVILAEGYFDLLALHQSELKQSVATSGTALTTQHIRILKRYTQNFITVFDADPAGVQASLRSLPLFLDEEVWGKIVLLPQGEDPDGFLRKGNLEAFEKMVDKALPLIDFFFDWMMKKHDMKSIENRVKVAREGMALISRVKDGIRKNFYLKALAEKLRLQESLLQEILRTPSKDRPRGGENLMESIAEETLPKPEQMVVRLMIHHPDLIPLISKEGIWREFENPTLRKMAEDLERHYQKEGRLHLPDVFGQAEEDFRKRLSELVFQEGVSAGDGRKILNDCIRKIREKKLKREKEELLRRIKEVEEEGGEKGLEVLLTQHQEMVRREMRLQQQVPSRKE